MKLIYEDEPDRDSWCSPLWLALILGWFDVDPCSNARSHIMARVKWDGIKISGLTMASTLDHLCRSYINPPYSRDQVMRWVFHYIHTNFTFLLRWDPSTTWFRVLSNAARCAWHSKKRIEFEPPPGVDSSSNPFPHALYFRESRKQVIARYPSLIDRGVFTDF